MGIHKIHGQLKNWNDARNTCIREGGKKSQKFQIFWKEIYINTQAHKKKKKKHIVLLMRQVYSYIFFIAESKSTVKLQSLFEKNAKKHDFFGIKKKYGQR